MKKRAQNIPSSFTIVFDREEDGRWIAEVPKLPGVMAYGATKRDAAHKACAVALRTLADSAERGKMTRQLSPLFKYEVARS